MFCFMVQRIFKSHFIHLVYKREENLISVGTLYAVIELKQGENLN